MAELSDEEKYKKKSELLKKALADADTMDAADKKKAAAAKPKKKRPKTRQKQEQMDKDARSSEPVLPSS